MQKERDALKAQRDELKRSIRLDGGIGTWRKIGTWASFGYVDNEEEIKQKITDLDKKLGDVTAQQTRVLGYSEVYQEAEKELDDWYRKDRERSQTALQRKIAEIQKEFTERETLLKQLITEQELRKDLTEKEQEELQQRRTALAGLNDEQQRRISLLKEEENLRLQKMKEEFEQKRADEAERRAWKERMEVPELAFQEAQRESQKADEAFQEALDNRRTANETPEKMSEKDFQLLDEAIEKTRSQAELWHQRLTEADEARNQRDIDAQTRYRDFVDQHQKEIEETEEQKAWEKQKGTDHEGAKRLAETTAQTTEAEFRREMDILDTLLRSRESTEVERAAQWQKVQDLQTSLKKWTGRVDELNVDDMESKKEDYQNIQTTRTSPVALMEGSAEAQQKILELRESRTNPLLVRADRTNELLEKSNGLMAEMSGKLEGV
ncbi:MAG: hypothetical protein Q4D38_14040 [Planctomycetia bacterium]|nr:hypothetical protein [Planctomycetia bacterium]